MIHLNDIKQQLNRLGVAQGDTILLTCSDSCLRKIENGADTIIDAIIDMIGGEGTLVVPTFTDPFVLFDAGETPSITGTAAEAVRRRPESIRSLHPTHSVAAIGALADAITEGHEKTNAFGKGSALFKVLQARGKVLQIGDNFGARCMTYVAEEVAGAPYLNRGISVHVKSPNGKIARRTLRYPGCSEGFSAIDDDLIDSGAIKETDIGECGAQLINARAIVDAAVAALKVDFEALLCDSPECELCAQARAMIMATEVEQQEKEITELAEEEERVRLRMERELDGPVDYFEPDGTEASAN